jgi:hypothetical protein
MTTSLRGFGLLLVCTFALGACPLGRPRELDCRSVRVSLARIDPRLAPYPTSSVTALNADQTRAWSEALGVSVAEVQQQVGYVADREVSRALEGYRDALVQLRSHTQTLDARARESGPGETVRRARAVDDARGRVDRLCPVSSTAR